MASQISLRALVARSGFLSSQQFRDSGSVAWTSPHLTPAAGTFWRVLERVSSSTSRTARYFVEELHGEVAGKDQFRRLQAWAGRQPWPENVTPAGTDAGHDACPPSF